jgi:gamma-glutamyltranspeptidase/glutathione hydrolase
MRPIWMAVLVLAQMLAGLAPAAPLRAQAVPEDPRTLRPPVPGVHGVVTAGHPLASTAGLRMLLRGGNAADAAVATLAVLHVVRPQMSGMGGNGFFTIYDRSTDRVYSLAATGAAPLALDPERMTPEMLDKGIKAGVVPGLFGGWIALLDRFGTMSLADVLEPAIDYAENGHPIEESVVETIRRSRELFEQHPSSARVFLPGGRVPEPGELFRMPDLANTLRKVVEAEREALGRGGTRSEALQAAFDRFYTGDIAREMARFYQENGGDFTLEDFAACRPIWGEPVHTTYRGYDVYSSPPTSRGGLEVTMQLNLVEGYDLRALGHNSPGALHLIAEAIKTAKADIYHYVADPKFTRVPVRELLSKEYAAERRSLIDRSRAMAYPGHGQPGGERRAAAPAAGRKAFPERSWDGSTTSFSIADRHGNVIAATPTHGGMFGTGVVVGSTGILFNNGTRIGSTSPYPDDVNYVRGGADPDPQQLPGGRDAGRQVRDGGGLAGRGDDRPDPVPGPPQRAGLRDGDPGGGHRAAHRPRRKPELLQARRRGGRPRGGPHPRGDAARARADGPRRPGRGRLRAREQQRHPAGSADRRPLRGGRPPPRGVRGRVLREQGTGAADVSPGRAGNWKLAAGWAAGEGATSARDS